MFFMYGSVSGPIVVNGKSFIDINRSRTNPHSPSYGQLLMVRTGCHGLFSKLTEVPVTFCTISHCRKKKDCWQVVT